MIWILIKQLLIYLSINNWSDLKYNEARFDFQAPQGVKKDVAVDHNFRYSEYIFDPWIVYTLE